MKNQTNLEVVARFPHYIPPSMELPPVQMIIAQSFQSSQGGNTSNLQISANDQSKSVLINCPYCRKSINTIVKDEIGVGTAISCFLLSFASMCCIPFCLKRCQDKTHKCPACMHEIGYFKYKPFC